MRRARDSAVRREGDVTFLEAAANFSASPTLRSHADGRAQPAATVLLAFIKPPPQEMGWMAPAIQSRGPIDEESENAFPLGRHPGPDCRFDQRSRAGGADLRLRSRPVQCRSASRPANPRRYSRFLVPDLCGTRTNHRAAFHIAGIQGLNDPSRRLNDPSR